MGVTPMEKVELATYQLKGVSQIWYNQWKEGRPKDEGFLDWEKFKVSFLDMVFSLEMREAKVHEFINLHQQSMSVREYALKFTQLSKYAPSMVVDPRERMSHCLKDHERDYDSWSSPPLVEPLVVMPWACEPCVTMKGILPQSSRGGPRVMVITTAREDSLEPGRGPLSVGH
ncbi:hypothetical protein MTR67_051828 [Solanum verrucosum]|uniref:Retrotransposon gag domain-containing protein n=1 Tax=Solanum verrucosum TaxID=315347 RepID=A0AAF1A2G2_SOLVR|nr:hypothetical protein MTR67_051828 [Solanum verrucosum]